LWLGCENFYKFFWQKNYFKLKGGDCDHDVEPESHVLLGELVLVLAVQPEELFPNLLRQFLLSLSSHLRVSLSLSVDEEGKVGEF